MSTFSTYYSCLRATGTTANEEVIFFGLSESNIDGVALTFRVEICHPVNPAKHAFSLKSMRFPNT